MAKPALLIRTLMALTAIGLAAAALSPNVPVLLVASVCFATVTVIPQILMPLAPALVAPEHRGRSLGVLSTGLVLAFFSHEQFRAPLRNLAEHGARHMP